MNEHQDRRRLIGRNLWAYLWAAPTSALGLVGAGLAVLSGGRVRWVDGALEVHGPALRPLMRGLNAAAVTLGHVIWGLDESELARCRYHEWVHVMQCERWGPFFLPAYFAAALLVRWRGGHHYRDNPFERQAYALQDRVRDLAG